MWGFPVDSNNGATNGFGRSHPSRRDFSGGWIRRFAMSRMGRELVRLSGLNTSATEVAALGDHSGAFAIARPQTAPLAGMAQVAGQMYPNVRGCYTAANSFWRCTARLHSFHAHGSGAG